MKKKKTKKAAAPMAATTTAKSWGLGAVSGKGGKTTNHAIQESMFQRELREAGKL